MTTAKLALDENIRFTRYAQIINGAIALLAVPFGIWILLSPERRVDPAWVFWLIWPMATLHTVEEYIFPGGFMAWFNRVAFNSPDPNQPLSPRRAFMIDAMTGVFIPPIIALAGSQFLPLVFVFASLLWWNAYWHILETIKTGSYFPGTVTALLVYVPGLSYVAYFYLSNGLISPLALAIALLVGLLANAAFYAQTRRWMHKNV
jgi:hypothetical protein